MYQLQTLFPRQPSIDRLLFNKITCNPTQKGQARINYFVYNCQGVDNAKMLKKRPRDVMDWQKSTFNTPRAKNDMLLSLLEKKLADDKAYKETLGKEAKCSQTHFFNRIAEEENEINAVDRLQNIKEEFHKRKLAILINKEKIAALEEEKRQKYLEEKRRLQLLQDSEEFRDFERQLQRARVAKQQAVQILSKENQLKFVKEAELEDQNRMEIENKMYSLAEEQQKQTREVQQRQYKSILLEQMERRRLQDEEETEKERERVRLEGDEIIKELKTERQKALEKRADKRREIQQTFEDYWKSHNNIKMKEKMNEEMETHRIHTFARQKEFRESKWIDMQNSQLNQISELKEKLGNLLMEERQQKERIENERLKIQQFKLQDDMKKQEESKLAVEERKKYIAKDSITYQYRLREAQLFREMAEEEKYRHAEIANLSKFASLDRQRVESKQEKQIEHLRQLRVMMEEMKSRTREEKMSNELFVRHVEAKQKVSNLAIQSEKLKVLKNEMTELWGHLPKCVLRSAGKVRNNVLSPI